MGRLGSAKLDSTIACSIMFLCRGENDSKGGGSLGPTPRGWGRKHIRSLVWALGHTNQDVLGYTASTVWVSSSRYFFATANDQGSTPENCHSSLVFVHSHARGPHERSHSVLCGRAELANSHLRGVQCRRLPTCKEFRVENNPDVRKNSGRAVSLWTSPTDRTLI